MWLILWLKHVFLSTLIAHWYDKYQEPLEKVLMSTVFPSSYKLKKNVPWERDKPPPDKKFHNCWGKIVDRRATYSRWSGLINRGHGLHLRRNDAPSMYTFELTKNHPYRKHGMPGQHWLRLWLDTKKAPSHYLNQCWPSDHGLGTKWTRVFSIADKGLMGVTNTLNFEG